MTGLQKILTIFIAIWAVPTWVAVDVLFSAYVWDAEHIFGTMGFATVTAICLIGCSTLDMDSK